VTSQNDGSTDGLGESLLGVPKPGSGLPRHDSPQDNEGVDTTMNDDSTAQAPTDPNISVSATEPATQPADRDPNAPVEIIVSDGNNQMCFKLHKNTKMGKLMARYAENQGRNRASMRFLFDGDKVVDGDTPASVSALNLMALFASRC